MSPYPPSAAYDSVDEVPLDELPSYGDPERTEPSEPPVARTLPPELEGWLGAEPPSIGSLVPEATHPMASPSWSRSDPEITNRLLDPRSLVLSTGVDALVGATAVFFAAMLGGLLGLF